MKLSSPSPQRWNRGRYRVRERHFLGFEQLCGPGATPRRLDGGGEGQPPRGPSRRPIDPALGRVAHCCPRLKLALPREEVEAS